MAEWRVSGRSCRQQQTILFKGMEIISRVPWSARRMGIGRGCAVKVQPQLGK
jgi:hypothetical protein